MYSIVLATALATSTVTPAWGHSCCGGCWGCHGCCGGCYGCWGCSGCCGGCWGCGGCCGGCWGCYGGCCGGCWGCYGGCGGGSSGGGYKQDTRKSDASPMQATVIVQLPADTSLTIDGIAVPGGSNVPPISTPDLSPGKDYYYTLKTQSLRGDSAVQTKRVMVRAGATVQVKFDDTAATARR